MKPNSNCLSCARITIVDDNHDNVNLIAGFLRDAAYTNVAAITNAAGAVSAIEKDLPDILLLDLDLSASGEHNLLNELRREDSPVLHIPILVFTERLTPQVRDFALKCDVSDFLTKPFDAQEILLRVRNFLHLRFMHLELERNHQELAGVVETRTAELTEARREALETLARVAELRDDETGQHTRRVGALSAAIAAELGQPPEMVAAIELAAPLHDVGKIALPDSILMKPGKLDPAEIETMRRHTLVAESVFSGMVSPMIGLARDIALNHHERWDGGGYPRGLAGDQIPLAARIVSVADVYDALTHERPYKRAWTLDEAITEIRSQSGRQFDPAVVEAFLTVVSRSELVAA